MIQIGYYGLKKDFFISRKLSTKQSDYKTQCLPNTVSTIRQRRNYQSTNLPCEERSNYFAKQLKASTLYEVIVAMALSAVLLALSFSLLSNVRVLFQEFTIAQSNVTSVKRFHRLMQQDFMRCREVVKRDDGFRCIYSNKIIEYKLLKDEGIQRLQNEMEDFLPCVPSRIETSFLNKPISDKNILIDQVKFLYQTETNEYSICLWKDYAADVKMAQVATFR